MIAPPLEPSRELHTAEQWYPKTAIPDLLGVPEECLDCKQGCIGLVVSR